MISGSGDVDGVTKPPTLRYADIVLIVVELHALIIDRNAPYSSTRFPFDRASTGSPPIHHSPII